MRKGGTRMNAVILLHQAWCNAAAQELSYKASERIFYELHKLDFTADDVTLAVKHLIRFNNKSGGAKFRINAFKICGDVESFASLVAEAKAMLRNTRKAQTASDKVLADYERVVDPELADSRIKGNGKSMKEILKNMAQ